MSRATKFEFPAQIGIDQSERSISNRQKWYELSYTTTYIFLFVLQMAMYWKTLYWVNHVLPSQKKEHCIVLHAKKSYLD